MRRTIVVHVDVADGDAYARTLAAIDATPGVTGWRASSFNADLRRRLAALGVTSRWMPGPLSAAVRGPR